MKRLIGLVIALMMVFGASVSAQRVPPEEVAFHVILKSPTQTMWIAPYLRALPSGAGWVDGDRDGYRCLYAFLENQDQIVGRVVFTAFRATSGQDETPYAIVQDAYMKEGVRFYDGTLDPTPSQHDDCPPPTAAYDCSIPASLPVVRYNQRRNVLETRDYRNVDAAPGVTFHLVESSSQRVGVLACEYGVPQLVVYYDSMSTRVKMTVSSS